MTDLLTELENKKKKGEDLSFSVIFEEDPNFDNFLNNLSEAEND